VLAPRIRDAVFLDLYAGSARWALSAQPRSHERDLRRARPTRSRSCAQPGPVGMTAGFRIHPGSVGAFLRLAPAPSPAERAKTRTLRSTRTLRESLIENPRSGLSRSPTTQPEYAAALGLLAALHPAARSRAGHREHRSKCSRRFVWKLSAPAARTGRRGAELLCRWLGCQLSYAGCAKTQLTARRHNDRIRRAQDNGLHASPADHIGFGHLFLAAALAYIAVKLTLLALCFPICRSGFAFRCLFSPACSLRRSALGLYAVRRSGKPAVSDDPGRVGGKQAEYRPNRRGQAFWPGRFWIVPLVLSRFFWAWEFCYHGATSICVATIKIPIESRFCFGLSPSFSSPTGWFLQGHPAQAKVGQFLPSEEELDAARARCRKPKKLWQRIMSAALWWFSLSYGPVCDRPASSTEFSVDGGGISC